MQFTEVVALIKQNDIPTLKELYVGNFPKMMRYALKNKGNPQSAKKIYQDAFVEMWQNIKDNQFSPSNQSILNKYLFRIAKNKWQAYLHIQKYKDTTFINRELEYDDQQKVENEHNLVNKKLISDSVNNLDEKSQQLLKLYYFDRNPLKEIAKIMQIDAISVQNKIFDCQKQLIRTIPTIKETIKRIDAYLLGNLDTQSIADFKERMKLFPDFRKLVAEQEIIIRCVETHNLKDSLETFHAEMDSVQKNNWLSPIWLALAGSVLILILVSIWAIWQRNDSPEKVFVENFKAAPGLPTSKAVTSNYDFFNGMVNYKRKEYNEAILRWEPLYAANPDNDTLVYFLGVANLAMGNTRQAKKYLYSAKEKTTSVFYEDIQYYLALALIKENKITEAKKVLENATSPASVALRKDIKSW